MRLLDKRRVVASANEHVSRGLEIEGVLHDGPPEK